MPPLSVAKAKRGSQAEWLRAIVEAMANAVVVTDVKGRVVLVNAALEQIFARRGSVGRRGCGRERVAQGETRAIVL